MSTYTPERREAARQRAYSLPPTYIPSEEDIRQACAAIQATWSDAEERSRRPRPKHWSLEELRCVDFCVG